MEEGSAKKWVRRKGVKILQLSMLGYLEMQPIRERVELVLQTDDATNMIG